MKEVFAYTFQQIFEAVGPGVGKPQGAAVYKPPMEKNGRFGKRPSLKLHLLKRVREFHLERRVLKPNLKRMRTTG